LASVGIPNPPATGAVPPRSGGRSPWGRAPATAPIGRRGATEREGSWRGACLGVPMDGSAAAAAEPSDDLGRSGGLVGVGARHTLSSAVRHDSIVPYNARARPERQHAGRLRPL